MPFLSVWWHRPLYNTALDVGFPDGRRNSVAVPDGGFPSLPRTIQSLELRELRLLRQPLLSHNVTKRALNAGAQSSVCKSSVLKV